MKKNPFDKLIELYKDDDDTFFFGIESNKSVHEWYLKCFSIDSHLLNEWYKETGADESELIVYMTLLFARLMWEDEHE